MWKVEFGDLMRIEKLLSTHARLGSLKKKLVFKAFVGS